jgi:hypothetical protein
LRRISRIGPPLVILPHERGRVDWLHTASLLAFPRRHMIFP